MVVETFKDYLEFGIDWNEDLSLEREEELKGYLLRGAYSISESGDLDSMFQTINACLSDLDEYERNFGDLDEIDSEVRLSRPAETEWSQDRYILRDLPGLVVKLPHDKIGAVLVDLSEKEYVSVGTYEPEVLATFDRDLSWL